MAKLVGVRERHHQPMWDTLVRAYGTTTLSSQTSIFGATNVGTKSLTNLQVAGQLASDQTYVIKVLRCFQYFHHTTLTSQAAFYKYVMRTLFFTLKVGDKPMFEAPCWYAPAGGGVWGYSPSTNILANGVPSNESILKLAYPIPVVARQNFQVEMNFYDITSDTDTVGPISLAEFNTTTYGVNACKIIQFFLDGIKTRDVQ